MRFSSSALLVSLLLSVFACSGEEESPTEYIFRIFDEKGVSVAETVNGPKYASPLFTVEEVARIHEDESITESLLTRPRWMGIDEDGMIYVLDGASYFEETRLVVYDQDGFFSHVIGREGHGPGEYQDPDLLSIGKGIISMYDAVLRRISWFSTDGAFLRLFTCAPDGALPERAYIDSENHQILIYSSNTSRGIIRRAVTLSSDGEPVGTIKTPRVRTYGGMETRTAKYSTPPHYSGSAMINYSAEMGIMVTTGNNGIINWYNLSGHVIKEYRLGLEPGPVTEEDHALADSYFRDLWSNGNPIGEDLYQSWLKKDKYPETRAFWCAASIDEYGYVWLEDPSSHFHKTEHHYRVVAPDGEYLGDCYLPQAMPQRNARISYGYYLLIDIDWDGEEQNLIVYRLKSTVEGLQFP